MLTKYNREELEMLNQGLFALFLVADFALFLSYSNSEFPWFALLGSAVGLSIIVLCWVGKKYTIFISCLIVFAIVHTVFYNWSAIIH